MKLIHGEKIFCYGWEIADDEARIDAKSGLHFISVREAEKIIEDELEQYRNKCIHAIKDWYTISPEYRTQERIAEMINNIGKNG